MAAESVMSTTSREALDTCAGLAAQIRAVAPLAASKSSIARTMRRRR
jgi:hypothetical protein